MRSDMVASCSKEYKPRRVPYLFACGDQAMKQVPVAAIEDYSKRLSDLPRIPSIPFPPSGGKGTPPPFHFGHHFFQVGCGTSHARSGASLAIPRGRIDTPFSSVYKTRTSQPLNTKGRGYEESCGSAVHCVSRAGARGPGRRLGFRPPLLPSEQCWRFRRLDERRGGTPD